MCIEILYQHMAPRWWWTQRNGHSWRSPMRRFMAPAFQRACWMDNFEARSAARSVWVWFKVYVITQWFQVWCKFGHVHIVQLCIFHPWDISVVLKIIQDPTLTNWSLKHSFECWLEGVELPERNVAVIVCGGHGWILWKKSMTFGIDVSPWQGSLNHWPLQLGVDLEESRTQRPDEYFNLEVQIWDFLEDMWAFFWLLYLIDKLVTFFWVFSHETNAMVDLGFNAWQVGTDKDYLASSIAYRLDLHGTAEVGFCHEDIDTKEIWLRLDGIWFLCILMFVLILGCLCLTIHGGLHGWVGGADSMQFSSCGYLKIGAAPEVWPLRCLFALQNIEIFDCIWICEYEVWPWNTSSKDIHIFKMKYIHISKFHLSIFEYIWYVNWRLDDGPCPCVIVMDLGARYSNFKWVYTEEQSCVTNYVVTVKHWIRKLRTMHSAVVHPSHLMHLSLLWMAWFGHQMEFLDSADD